MILRANLPEFEIIGDVRCFTVDGLAFQAYEFRADVTGWERALAISDGFDANVLEIVPAGWRRMSGQELLRLAVERADGILPTPPRPIPNRIAFKRLK